MIEVLDLSKRFGDVEAVRGVGFTAEDGRITGLLGPNGAGKTTTLRLVYTALRPDAGDARIDGVSVLEDPQAVRRALGVLPSSRGLYPRLTGRENIRYYGRLQGLGGGELEASIDELVSLLDMSDIADRRTEGFSTGQTLKVAIGRALVHRPQNLLLDEPTAGLDVLATRSMRTVIRRLRDEGRCILFSSHVMQEVAALCERVEILARGRRVGGGSPEELLAQTGESSLEDAFVGVIGSAEGLG